MEKYNKKYFEKSQDTKRTDSFLLSFFTDKMPAGCGIENSQRYNFHKNFLHKLDKQERETQFMPEFEFIKKPDFRQTRNIVDLYISEGWWKEGRDTDELVSRIVSGSQCFLTAIEDGSIIGMGRAISDGFSDAYIQDVTVSVHFRGRGIGAEIIKKLSERLYNDGIRWIGLIAEKNSHGFYEKLGFSAMQGCVPMLKTM